MIKLKQILNEITFDLSTAFPFKYIGGKDNEYRFDTGKNEYKVVFKPDGESTYERVYHTTDRGLGNNFEDTKEGIVMAIAVNATVMKITLDFIERTPDFSMIYMVPISRSRFNTVKKFLEKYLPKKYPFVAEASDNGEDIIAIYRDEQTKNILSEIEVGMAIPKFKNNDELARYIKNSLNKKQLIDTMWDAPKWRLQGPDWESIRDEWYNSEIIQYGDYNESDEIMISDDDDNRAYISILPLPFEPDVIDHKVEFGPNTIYWQYF
jgi:hypothetical protein